MDLILRVEGKGRVGKRKKRKYIPKYREGEGKERKGKEEKKRKREITYLNIGEVQKTTLLDDPNMEPLPVTDGFTWKEIVDDYRVFGNI